MSKEDEQARFIRLASLIQVTPAQLARHAVRPLAPPADRLPDGWVVPSACRDVLSITDGLDLFSADPSHVFRLWGAHDYDVCARYGGPIFAQAGQDGLFPIYGDIPHLTSVSIADGCVVATDWEVYGQAEHGWRAVIAADLSEYLRTVILVREAYGDEEDCPSDWWGPTPSRENATVGNDQRLDSR
jgi:hypothetical protein